MPAPGTQPRVLVFGGPVAQCESDRLQIGMSGVGDPPGPPLSQIRFTDAGQDFGHPALLEANLAMFPGASICFLRNSGRSRSMTQQHVR